MLIILKAMIDFKKIKEYPIKKCKGFGYTFGAVFLAFTFYFFFKFESFKLFLSISLCFFLLTFFFPACFKLPAFLWEKFTTKPYHDSLELKELGHRMVAKSLLRSKCLMV